MDEKIKFSHILLQDLSENLNIQFVAQEKYNSDKKICYFLKQLTQSYEDKDKDIYYAINIIINDNVKCSFYKYMDVYPYEDGCCDLKLIEFTIDFEKKCENTFFCQKYIIDIPFKLKKEIKPWELDNDVLYLLQDKFQDCGYEFNNIFNLRILQNTVKNAKKNQVMFNELR